MPRVLLVVSSFSPAMLADMQRARMLAWELPSLGWAVEVLTPSAAEVRQDAIEPDPGPFFPDSLTIHEVGSICRSAFELMGSHTHAWRTLWPMYQRGCRLLQSGRYDLVYISTATSIYFSLGAWWKRRFAVPYVLDFHDPWVRDLPASAPRPRIRERLINRAFHHLERTSVGSAAGVIAVSPRYIEQLRRRYANLKPAWLAPSRNAVIPFSASQRDFEVAARRMSSDEGASGAVTIAYVGAGGPIMARSFDLICCALAVLRRNREPVVERVRIRLFGTIHGWRDGMPKDLEHVAQLRGVADLVEEMPARVSFRESLETILHADGVLVLGVDDPGYMPSKLFSYALSEKPLLASFRHESPAFKQLTAAPILGHVLWFGDSGKMPDFDAAVVVHDFLEEAAARNTIDRGSALEPHLAPAMAHRHAEVFSACLASEAGTGR